MWSSPTHHAVPGKSRDATRPGSTCARPPLRLSHNPFSSISISLTSRNPQSSLSLSHFRKKSPNPFHHLRLLSVFSDNSISLLLAHCCDIPSRPTPINRNLPSFRHAFLSRLPSIHIPQQQSCQTSTTAPLTMPLPCSRTLTPLTTTTVARVADLVCPRLRMPTVNSNSKLKEVPRSFPRLLPTTHTSETLKLPRVSSLRMTRSSVPSTS